MRNETAIFFYHNLCFHVLETSFAGIFAHHSFCQVVLVRVVLYHHAIVLVIYYSLPPMEQAILQSLNYWNRIGIWRNSWAESVEIWFQWFFHSWEKNRQGSFLKFCRIKQNDLLRVKTTTHRTQLCCDFYNVTK